jgi:uracil-DNA glycosylase
MTEQGQLYSVQVTDFEQWRDHARNALAASIPPCDMQWQNKAQSGLFDAPLPPAPDEFVVHISRQAMGMLHDAACFRNSARWGIMYRLLWRLVYEEPELLSITTDNDVMMMHRMVSEVRRDSHKMKAFVRFKQVECYENTYIAWHEPTHYVLERVAPFFVRRFTSMHWSILTPYASAYWNGDKLRFGEGQPRSSIPHDDAVEELWKTFYRHIFNPARIKMDMMLSEMPKKYWHTMPETALIPSMLEEADARVKKMIKDSNKDEDNNTFFL